VRYVLLVVGMSPADEMAFRAYASSHRAALRRTAFLLCGDWHQADDLVQSTLVKLFVAWPRMRSADRPEAYARRTLVHCFLDERRRPWRREAPVDGFADQPAGADPSDLRLDLRAALDRLPARQRATVLLRYWADATVAEAADALGCSEGTVKSQTARALHTLRGLLADPALVTEESS
jgi:RNA polymerase sigma-70 factor (sigma-E family)